MKVIYGNMAGVSPNRLSAFTLIELSISLVIIGLIVGGILGARDLIRQAEVRGIASDFHAYEMAVNTFKLKYDAWPGDMRNATDYWPGVTANGDGNGLVSHSQEMFRAWKQLELSGIISGGYTGVGAGNEATVGVNVPQSPINSVGYCLYQGTAFAVSLRNFLHLGSFFTGGCLWGASLTTSDSKSLDDKLDDGVANTGKIITPSAAGQAATSCSQNVAHATGTDYNLSNTDVVCRPLYMLEK